MFEDEKTRDREKAGEGDLTKTKEGTWKEPKEIGID
jgi:hypothetical protein